MATAKATLEKKRNELGFYSIGNANGMPIYVSEERLSASESKKRVAEAELLMDHYSAEKKEATEHLDFAIKEFLEMKMQPSLERAP